MLVVVWEREDTEHGWADHNRRFFVSDSALAEYGCERPTDEAALDVPESLLKVWYARRFGPIGS